MNSIPARAGVKVDLRSEDEDQLSRMESLFAMPCKLAGATKLAPPAPERIAVQVNFRSIGTRPAGSLPKTPLL